MYIIKPDNKVIANALRHISELDSYKEWQIDIKPHKKNKSAQQRNYYHKLLEIISNHTGDEADDLKTRICYALDYVREVKLKSGETVLQRLSTEKLGVGEYSKMIESAQMMCAYLELKYPQPSHFGMEI